MDLRNIFTNEQLDWLIQDVGGVPGLSQKEIESLLAIFPSLPWIEMSLESFKTTWLNCVVEYPIHQDQHGWWFWDKTWDTAHGPYLTQELAVYGLAQYVKQLG